MLRGNDPSADLWAIQLKDALPVVPVPLKAPDADIRLDLQGIFASVYEKSYYGLSINYQKPAPPPPFTVEEAEWIEGCAARWSMDAKGS